MIEVKFPEWKKKEKKRKIMAARETALDWERWSSSPCHNSNQDNFTFGSTSLSFASWWWGEAHPAPLYLAWWLVSLSLKITGTSELQVNYEWIIQHFATLWMNEGSVMNMSVVILQNGGSSRLRHETHWVNRGVVLCHILKESVNSNLHILSWGVRRQRSELTRKKIRERKKNTV